MKNELSIEEQNLLSAMTGSIDNPLFKKMLDLKSTADSYIDLSDAFSPNRAVCGKRYTAECIL